MSKRLLAWVTLLALVTGMFAFTTSAMAWEWRYSHCSNGKPLNIRSGPGKEYSVISRVAYGEQIGVDHDLGNGWSEVYVGSQGTGYCMTSLMSRTQPGPYVPDKKPSGDTPTSTIDALYKQAKLVAPYDVTLNPTRNSGGVVNVRWAPSKSAPLLAKYNAGATVTVIAQLGNNWFQVQDPNSGAVGFVNVAYVTK